LKADSPVHYKEIRISCGYRVYLLVKNKIIAELKSVDKLKLIHEAQFLTYVNKVTIK
jgi:GxxExxY protein